MRTRMRCKRSSLAVVVFLAHEQPEPGNPRHPEENGFVWFRTGKGDHEIWQHAETGKRVTVEAKVKTRHTANNIMRDTGLPKAF